MARVSVRHVGEHRVDAVARDHAIRIDRPREAGGTDTGMSIAEVFLSSLGACTLLTVLTFCEQNGIELSGIDVEVEGEVVDNPRRLGRIAQRLTLRGGISERERETIERVAKRCAVHNTLERCPELALDLRVVES